MDTDHSANAQGVPRPAVPGHEIRDVSTGWIFGLVVFLILSLIGVHFIIDGFMNSLKKNVPTSDRWQPIPRPAAMAPRRAPFPKLQVSAPADLQAFREREDAELNTYGWVNVTARVVRIPIARAMELVLQKGLPVRNGTNQSKAGPSSYDLIQQRPLHREPEIQAPVSASRGAGE